MAEKEVYEVVRNKRLVWQSATSVFLPHTCHLKDIGKQPAHITDVSWRLQYQVKNGLVEKVNEPLYLISLNTENKGHLEDINFTCTMEQLQDMVGKLKDAAKSAEKASQMG